MDMLRLASEAAAEEAMSSQPAVESDTETAVCCCRTEKAGSDVVKRENNVMGYDRLTSLSRLYWSQAGNTQTAPMISPPQTSRRTEWPQRPVAVSLGAACCCDAAAAAAAAALRAM